jgi:hypothetical protein
MMGANKYKKKRETRKKMASIRTIFTARIIIIIWCIAGKVERLYYQVDSIFVLY